MDREQMRAMLLKTGVKSVVHGWYEQGHKPDFPYIVFTFLSNDPFCADGEIFLDRHRWQVDLVTKRRDESLETKLEKALRDQGLVFSKTQTADSDDSYVVVHYRFETLGG